MNIAQEAKQSLNLYKLIFNILLLCHLTACTWYWIVIYEDIWIPTYDYITGTTEFFEEDKFTQYVSVFYTGVLMVLGNEVGPRTNMQLAFLSSYLVGSAIINAHIFGSLAVIV